MSMMLLLLGCLATSRRAHTTMSAHPAVYSTYSERTASSTAVAVTTCFFTAPSASGGLTACYFLFAAFQELETLQQGMKRLQARVVQQDATIKHHEKELLDAVQVSERITAFGTSSYYAEVQDRLTLVDCGAQAATDIVHLIRWSLPHLLIMLCCAALHCAVPCCAAADW